MKCTQMIVAIGCAVGQFACGSAGDGGASPAGVAAEGIGLGADGPEVAEARQYLTRFGYFPNGELAALYPDFHPMLPATSGDASHFDTGLETAVKKYQRNSGLAPTGVLDSHTLQAMATPRCGVPDVDPDGPAAVEKWALLSGGRVWSKTALTYRISQPSVTLSGLASADDTRSKILQGFALWFANTELTFTPVTSGEDILVNYADLGTVEGSSSGTTITINSRATFTATTLRLTAAHEVGHIIGLHHSSNWVAGATTPPLMGPAGNATGLLTPDDRVAANVLYNSWELLPGAALDIAVGVDGSVWIIDATTGQPRKWNGTGWEARGSVAERSTRLDVDSSGRPWIVATSNRLYRYDGLNWNLMPGLLRDIGIGTAGQVYGVGMDNRVWRWANNAWSQVFNGSPAGATSLDVDMDGSVHVVAANNEIWACANGCIREAGGLGLDVSYGGPSFFTFGVENWGWAIGLGDTIWARNRQVAIPNASASSNTPAADTWVQVSGGARRISVGPSGRAWLVNSKNQIYRRNELP